MFVAVDFDGTMVKHRFPEIGPPVPYAIKWLKIFQAVGIDLILLTMRSDGQTAGNVLTDAINYCKENEVYFKYCNENPEQLKWTNSNKVYANYYIDDAAIG